MMFSIKSSSVFNTATLSLDLLTKKDEKIADLMSICRKELRAMSNENMTDTGKETDLDLSCF